MSANGFVAVAHLSWDLMIGVFPQFTLFLLMFFVTCFSYFKAFDLPIYLRIKTTAGTCPLEMLGLVSMKNSLIFWIMLYFFVLIHPWSLTWNRKMEPWKSKPFLEISIFRFLCWNSGVYVSIKYLIQNEQWYRRYRDSLQDSWAFTTGEMYSWVSTILHTPMDS